MKPTKKDKDYLNSLSLASLYGDRIRMWDREATPMKRKNGEIWLLLGKPREIRLPTKKSEPRMKLPMTSGL